MASVNIYEQYFKAECEYNGVSRHAALVMLISDSEGGNITYTAAVTFFPHSSDDDYAVSYDAYFSTVLFNGKGRRSKKREEQLIDKIRETIDILAEQSDGKVFWDEPLNEAKYG
ncbi:MAG: hypothetical protein K6C13_07620 [Oscillospiraceae bacterium]|nr:hypothetical protein [Oscillospiraceae bacterium]